MSTWYYYDNNGQKRGPITGGQLKGLAKAGMITSETVVETEDGKKIRAGKMKGLICPNTTQVEPIPPKSEQETAPTGQNPFTADMPTTNSPFTAPMPTVDHSFAVTVPAGQNPFIAGMPATDNPFNVPMPTADHSLSTGTSYKTSIIIERKDSIVTSWHPYGVLLDGIEIGTLKKNGMTEYALTPGQHVLSLKAKTLWGRDNQILSGPDWVLRSKEIVFTITDGEHVSFFVKSAFSLFNWKIWVLNVWWYCFLEPDGWIILTKR